MAKTFNLPEFPATLPADAEDTGENVRLPCETSKALQEAKAEQPLYRPVTVGEN